MTKKQLLDEVLAIGGNHKLSECEEAEAKILDYLKKNEDDPQVKDVLSIIRMGIIEHEYSDFESCSKLSAPIFERLLNKESWDFYDIRILAIVIDYAETYERSCVLTDIALASLEKYSHEKKYLHVKLIFHSNTMLRLIRALYFETDGLNARKTYTKLRDIFYTHYNAIKDICGKGNFPVFYEVASIRKGIFYRSDALISKGLETLKELEKPEIYRMLENEVAQYKSYSKLNINKVQFDATVGENIRKIRVTRGMSQLKTSNATGLTASDISAMEAGKRAITSFNLFKLAHVFDVPTDEFFIGIEILLSPSDLKEEQIQKIVDMAERFTEEEMASVIDIMKTMQKEGQSKHK